MPPPLPHAAVVLDTNAVLDWLLFDDPAGRAVGEQVVVGTITWLACDAMRDECFHVLGRAPLAAWQPDRAATRAHFEAVWSRHAHLVSVMTGHALALGLHCRDADDQVYLDVATQHGAKALLTKDKDLLSLRKRAASHGLRICTPVDWLASSINTG